MSSYFFIYFLKLLVVLVLAMFIGLCSNWWNGEVLRLTFKGL